MAAHRERRRKNLVQFTVAVAADELAVIARSGYPEVREAEDEKRAVEAISLFIADTLAARSARVTALRRATPSFSNNVTIAATSFQSPGK